MPGDGRFIQVTTPNVTRAKQLTEIYNDLKNPHLNMEERLTILLNTKITVSDCLNKLATSKVVYGSRLKDLLDEILDLIKREAELLNRGRPEKSLTGLRLRMANLFLQFIESPETNPEASQHQKVPANLLRRDLERAKKQGEGAEREDREEEGVLA